jgi:4-carboxymuconolactone decarboxylase
VVTGLLELAAALGTRNADLIRTRLSEAAAAGLGAEVDEVLLMAFFVTGFPAGLDAARIWQELRPVPPRAGEGEGREGDVARRGREVCRAVYGDQLDPLLEGLANLHPDLPELVIEVGYGRMMARPGLPLTTRELCMVGMLVPWRADTQLYSHLRGALRVGASHDDVEQAVEAGCRALQASGGDPAAALAARSGWARVVARANRDDRGHATRET